MFDSLLSLFYNKNMKSYIEEREMIIVGLKYTKMYRKVHNPERNFLSVKEELVKEILYSDKRKKDYVRISRGDGVMVMWFRHDFDLEQMQINLENNEEEWYKTREQCFSFSDEYENYNIWVAEFKSLKLLDQEEYEYWNGLANFEAGVKEDTGKYSVWDVYSERELL
jgi:hypothetical protein